MKTEMTTIWISKKHSAALEKIRNKLQLSRKGVVAERMINHFLSTKNYEELR